jgi:sarcosine oxidase subunit alpha
MKRLTGLPTLRIDPRQQIGFHYRRKQLQGLKGDTVATALYANGVRIFSRSIKYHRPRGLYSLDGESANCLMDVNRQPNVPTETTLLRREMRVRPQNVIGSPENDALGFLDMLDWAMPAGFYYRCMHKPYTLWPTFLNLLRKTAGLGRVQPSDTLPGSYAELYPNADVCVIGGGPAGMSAALAAAEYGLRVILLESRPWLGGFFDYRTAVHVTGVPLWQRGRDLSRLIAERPNIRVFNRTTVVGVYADYLISAFQVGSTSDDFEQRYLEVRSPSIVVATGCRERPLLFENNERPGVMQVGAAHRLARTYGLLPGRQAVFSIGHDLGLEAAVDLADLGLNVCAVADHRSDGQDPRLIEALAKRRIQFLRGWVATKAYGTKSVRKVRLSTIEGAQRQDLRCDLLVASAGLTPVSGPLSLSHADIQFDLHTGFYVPVRLPTKMYAAGRLLGYHDAAAVEASGKIAGLAASGDVGTAARAELDDARATLASLPGPVRGSKLVHGPIRNRKVFVCFDEDTTLKNVNQACQMGFDTIELTKRFSAAGTGPGQGGIPGHNLPLVLAKYLNSPSKPTVVRAPLAPTLIATYAGSHPDLVKRTPLHEVQAGAGAIFRRVGVWERARYFSKDYTCWDEIKNVRTNVGLIDVSTVGKFRLFGPDAEKVLQRVYAGNMSALSEGKLKYAVACNEDGNLIDDGVVVKQADHNYYLTTSSARAGETIPWLRYHARHDGWHFHVVNLTDALGAVNLAGPNSREVLRKVTDADVSNEALPYMGYRELTLKGTIRVRVLRLGFVGELSFELHVPASYTRALWDLLMEAGREYEIRPFGLEAQNVLRLEKGHIIIGQESEIRTTLHDLGLGSLWYRHKPQAKTVGAFALMQTEHQEDRLKLVGFRVTDSKRAPRDGSIVVDAAIRGYVCTARYSYTLKEAIGLALVHDSLAEVGTRLQIFEDGAGRERLPAEVVATPFYDPEGRRVRM